jgi:prophage DNA circulation protein
MADQQTPKPNTTAAFNPSPNALSAANYQTIVQEREELVRKQLAADNEFMHQHYERLIKAADISYERASKANLILERRQRRETAKQRKESLRARPR